MDDGKKECLKSSLDTCGGGACNSTKKVFKATGKERNTEGRVQGLTSKGSGELVDLTDSCSIFVTDERRHGKESLKRDLEVLKRKLDQAHAEAKLDSVKPKLGKVKKSFIRVCDGNLLVDKGQPFTKGSSSGKLGIKESEKDEHHSFEMVKENGRDKESHHAEKTPVKEKEQGRREEKGLGMVNEKKGAQPYMQKRKGSNEEKRGSDGSDKGKAKKMGVVGGGSGDVSGDCSPEDDRLMGKVAISGKQQRKRMSVDKNEKSGNDGEKDEKNYARERGCSSGTKERQKHIKEGTVVDQKVKGRDKESKDKGKRKKHSSGSNREHDTGKNSETGKVSYCSREGFGGLNDVKTVNSCKGDITGDPNNHLHLDLVQKSERGNCFISFTLSYLRNFQVILDRFSLFTSFHSML